jgi:hypothetical protein
MGRDKIMVSALDTVLRPTTVKVLMLNDHKLAFDLEDNLTWFPEHHFLHPTAWKGIGRQGDDSDTTSGLSGLNKIPGVV